VIVLSLRARTQIDALIGHYERLGRIEASQNLLTVIETASSRILSMPEAGLAAPRPYPDLARMGRLWLHVRPYWIAYTLADPPVIVGVYYDAANIPKRL
jgi:plasmid stabilization system protein ParE